MSEAAQDQDELSGDERHELELALAEERRQEAQAARAEQPDEDEDEDEQPPPADEDEQPPPAEPTAEELEQAAMWLELEKAQTAYQRKVAKILGAENVPPLCQQCEGTGYDQTAGAGELEYQVASDSERCQECAGLGSVRTGSEVPDKKLKHCGRCGGAGYLVVPPAEVAQPHLVAPAIVEAGNGTGAAEELLRVRPGDPGWEPWMGTPSPSR